MSGRVIALRLQIVDYKSVIINLRCAHSVMPVRPMIYTAITRAKEKGLIVGERRALCTAIRRNDTEQHGTKLAQKINEFSKYRKGVSFMTNAAKPPQKYTWTTTVPLLAYK